MEHARFERIRQRFVQRFGRYPGTIRFNQWTAAQVIHSNQPGLSLEQFNRAMALTQKGRSVICGIPVVVDERCANGMICACKPA